MALTAFGKAVRKARIDANETLVSMATAIGTSPAYLSGMETGRKKISVEWAVKITNFFRSRNVWVKDLQELAYISNNAVPVKGLPFNQSNDIFFFHLFITLAQNSTTDITTLNNPITTKKVITKLNVTASVIIPTKKTSRVAIPS